ncbi:MAG: hypothetical protein JRJ03_12360 [Deltaproteobacteria bacterium]|nr:hypothetical protein [Deltaproteobacteria bacterium]
MEILTYEARFLIIRFEEVQAVKGPGILGKGKMFDSPNVRVCKTLDLVRGLIRLEDERN